MSFGNVPAQLTVCVFLYRSVVLVELAGLVATLLASLNERRRELAILRALGAGPRDIFLILTAEGVCITACGALLGMALLVVGLWLGAGVVMPWRPPGTGEIGLLLAILAVGLLASLVPGWRAWRMSLADGLTPQV